MEAVGALLELITKYGVMPVLLVVIWWMKKEIETLKVKVDAINTEHKADLKAHTDEMKSLMQNFIGAKVTNDN